MLISPPPLHRSPLAMRTRPTPRAITRPSPRPTTHPMAAPEFLPWPRRRSRPRAPPASAAPGTSDRSARLAATPTSSHPCPRPPRRPSPTSSASLWLTDLPRTRRPCAAPPRLRSVSETPAPTAGACSAPVVAPSPFPASPVPHEALPRTFTPSLPLRLVT